MEKHRYATRVFAFNEKGEVLAIQYKKGNKVEFYFEVPGGKIEEGETLEMTAIREVKEETGVDIKNLKFKGVMNLYTPFCHFILNLFICNDYSGEPIETEENFSMWIDKEELLKKEKILLNLICLDRFFVKSLLNSDKLLLLDIHSDGNENILEMNYKLVDKIDK